MTDQHPLTDEIIEEIARFDPDEDDMRAAADWQLEQVIKALNQCKKEKRSCCEVLYLFHQKLEAMRPTTTQEESDD